MALSAAGLRLRRTAYGIGQIPDQPWFRTPGLDSSPRLLDTIAGTCGSYLELSQAIASRSPIPDTTKPGDETWLLESFNRSDGNGFGAGLARIWLYENLQYLVELNHRFEHRARMLFEVSSEDPPPTGDIPMPREPIVRHPATAAQSG